MSAARRSIVLVLAVLCVVLARGAHAQGDVRPPLAGDCGPALRVEYRDEADLRHACEALDRIRDYLLNRHRLCLTTPLRLVFDDVVEVDFGPQRIRVLGYHDRQTRLLRVTSFASPWLREGERLIFGERVNAELHVSILVHELVHAVLKDNYRIAVPGFASDEYIAYAVQLATMDPALRERLLRAHGADAFGTLDEITDIYHLMRPQEFALRAYLHFVREGEARMLAMVLSGEFNTVCPW